MIIFYCLFKNVFSVGYPPRGEGCNPINRFNYATFLCLCQARKLDFQCHMLWSLFMFNELRWFSPGTPVSSTNKTDRHNIVESGIKHHQTNNINGLSSEFRGDCSFCCYLWNY
jgi:hypothetical protein